MDRQSKFEKLWADRHGISPADLIQYRFKEKDGYRLPAMAAHYRTFCDALDSVVVDLGYATNNGYEAFYGRHQVHKAIEAAGLRVAQ